MKRKFSFLLWLILITSLTQAHEFWMLSSKFRYNVGETAGIDFKVGENFLGDYWDLQKHKVERLDAHNRTGVKSILNHVKTTKGNNIQYHFASVGTHLISLQSSAAYVESESEVFNEYLKEDGLENIIEHRTRTNTMDEMAREYYTRYAKLLIQSGDRTDETYRKSAGLKYEIIPQKNPYDLNPGDYLPCLVLYEGQPASHTLVKVWNQVGNRTFLQNIYTEKDGTITFPISNSGSWMVSSVKMIRSNYEGADYESMWASLVFGIN